MGIDRNGLLKEPWIGQRQRGQGRERERVRCDVNLTGASASPVGWEHGSGMRESEGERKGPLSMVDVLDLHNVGALHSMQSVCVTAQKD